MSGKRYWAELALTIDRCNREGHQFEDGRCKRCLVCEPAPTAPEDPS